MNLSEDVDLEEFVHAKDELSGADIKAVCTEAGLLALRERRMRVTMADLRSAREKTMFAKKDNGPEGLCEFSSFPFLSFILLPQLTRPHPTADL
jgi:26S proteasome regulatory subunit T2